MANLYDFWRSLSKEERVLYAESVGLSFDYLDNHVIHRRKVPPIPTLKKMADESNGVLSLHGLVDFFAEKNSPVI